MSATVPDPAAPAAATAASAGRRERKKRATRAALRSAALELALERGVDAVTVEDIADQADVSARTFFNYFSSKEEALAGPDAADAETLHAALAARPAEEPPLAALRAVLLELVAGDIAARRREWAQRREIIAAHPGVLAAHLAAWAELERALVAGVADRIGADPDRDVYPLLVVAAATGATRAAAMRWRATRGAVPLPDLVADALDQLAAGLPAPPPKESA